MNDNWQLSKMIKKYQTQFFCFITRTVMDEKKNIFLFCAFYYMRNVYKLILAVNIALKSFSINSKQSLSFYLSEITETLKWFFDLLIS